MTRPKTTHRMWETLADTLKALDGLTYIDTWSDEAKPYYEIIREHILANQIFRSGDWHQAEGVPVFSDGTVAAMSMRAWGDMMASIYNTRFGASYSYWAFCVGFDDAKHSESMGVGKREGGAMTMPETIDFTDTSWFKEERNWYRATSAAWGEIELAPYSRPERGPWIATWECSPTSYGYAQAMVILRSRR